ncbi:MAG: CoA activase [Deltaproteobacteria bacterium]|nr:CoA activase [Deltaproteobacteria bacterium]
MDKRRYYIGMDVGSTTVKAVVVDGDSDMIIWQDYQRHESKQQEKALEFLQRIERELDIKPDDCYAYITGSGGGGIAPQIGARFVQEVNAVSLAVEKLFPECGSVIELGGQDAKIIVFQEDIETKRKRKIPTMNDKCAGGTGAVIDKINAKLNIPPEQLSEMGYLGHKLHPVAAKCGVFAETDINGLQKLGVPREELMASLFEAIIQQNISVLTRGNTLLPHVLLLGGPNTYIKGMQECWKVHIPKMWEERKVSIPEGVLPESLVIVPDNAEYFAAIGAVEYGKEEEENLGLYAGWLGLEHYITHERGKHRKDLGCGAGLSSSPEELEAFKKRFSIKKFEPARVEPGEAVEAWLGIDGGSTSTKAVLMDKDGEVICKSYQLSKGDPIEDTVDICADLRSQIESQGATLKIMGVGTTGYAKDILKDILSGDVALVETVAHTQSALHYYKDVDLICDVGGQDIKLILLRNGRVVDFKLNTQCSAGNGYFLQSTAETFGYAVEEFSDLAFKADSFPQFGYGCAVFLQSDIVNFQRQGWKPEEIMAGLANILPKNIWLYVAQIPNLATLGTNFVLQGGTQHNLAAVKAQVDYIESRFEGKDREPNIWVHRYTGECGAIGTALEAIRLYENGHRTSFIGLDAIASITYHSTRNEDTRCYFCTNNCQRTFIDIKTGQEEEKQRPSFASKVPLEPDAKRLIIAACEKGTVESADAMRHIKKGVDAVMKENPNLSEVAASEVFKPQKPEIVADPLPRYALTKGQRRRIELMERRGEVTIGIPRVLNMYSLAPWFRAYFESLGIDPKKIIFSDYTSEKLYKEGAKRGAIDPCFPSKLGIPHIHNLLYKIHPKRRLDFIFFPMIDCIPSTLENTMNSRSCPTVAATPEATKAAFIKEGDLFKEKGITLLNTYVNLSERALVERQMFNEFKDILGLSQKENQRAIAEGYSALNAYGEASRRRGREVIDRLVADERIGIVILGRPYHNDPGVNHGILTELQKYGYPILTHECLPTDPDILEQLFGEEVRAGRIVSGMDISDVWKNSFSENSNMKIWAAKYAARHPNLVALELSSFKCGHDAPIYTVVQETVERSGTPYFCFKDIDENKPSGSIKIRVETIHYFLTRYREDLVKKHERQAIATDRTMQRDPRRRNLPARTPLHTSQ